MLAIVHGDEYGWGSGGPFNGTTLASYGQIIVVTINYRLGPFGQLSVYHIGNGSSFINVFHFQVSSVVASHHLVVAMRE